MRKCSKTFRERSGGKGISPQLAHDIRNDKSYNMLSHSLLAGLFQRAGLPTVTLY